MYLSGSFSCRAIRPRLSYEGSRRAASRPKLEWFERVPEERSDEVAELADETAKLISGLWDGVPEEPADRVAGLLILSLRPEAQRHHRPDNRARHP